MIVIDASALTEALLETTLGVRIYERGEGLILNAPYLIDLEVSNVLGKLVRNARVRLVQGRAVVEALTLLPLERWDHRSFLPRLWELRDNLSSYDASYVALAESLDAPLITTDAGIATAPNHRAKVELFARQMI